MNEHLIIRDHLLVLEVPTFASYYWEGVGEYLLAIKLLEVCLMHLPFRGSHIHLVDVRIFLFPQQRIP